MNKNIKLVLETIVIFVLNGGLALLIQSYISNQYIKFVFYIPLLLFQGLWFYRIYIVGHESAHKKLFIRNQKLNDIIGSIVLIPLLVPITVYRKIHYFHHGFNRKDEYTSNLDTFVVRGKFKQVKKIYYYIVWYVSVFCGGFFLHSLVSVLLFLFVPPILATKISPAFKGWTLKDQFVSILLFSSGLLFHFSIYYFFGIKVYLFTLGYPLLCFGLVLSMLVYIFHYDATIGDEVRYNVRSVEHVPFFSWVLMNFNEHATHHQFPNIPWYELPEKRKSLPEFYNQKNQNTWNFFKAILNQLKGPNIHYEN